MHTTRALWTTIALTTALFAVAATGAGASGGTGGGGTGGGGGGGGGGTSTAPTLVAGPCAKVTSFSPTAGYRPGGGSIGAVWLSYTVQSCNTDFASVDVNVTETPADGGPVWAWTTSPYLAPNGSFGVSNVDNDWAEVNMQYNLVLTVTDPSTGSVLATASKLISTPKGKTGIA